MRGCNAPYVTWHICIPTLAIFGTKLWYSLMIGFCPRFAFCPCHSSHIMSSCASHLHTYSSQASEHFPRCPFCIPTLLRPPAPPFCLVSCAGVKRSRIGPRLAKRPWFTTGRPPLKFRAIWSPFDTPTVNRGTEKASCVLQPNTSPKCPKTHLSPLHHLGHSITIAWPKTVLNLEPPSSFYV